MTTIKVSQVLLLLVFQRIQDGCGHWAVCIRGDFLGPAPSHIWATRQVVTSIQRQEKEGSDISSSKRGIHTLMDQTNQCAKEKLIYRQHFQSTYPQSSECMNEVTQIPAVRVWLGQRNSAHMPWPKQREKLEQEDQTGPTAGRREASVDLSLVPTFVAATGCCPAAGLHPIEWGFLVGL